MKNADMPIRPTVIEHEVPNGHSLGRPEYRTVKETLTGLTKREYFAGLAMQGLLINGINNVSTASNAVKCADELLKELLKGNENNSIR